jgi:hypothetical protein
MTDWTDRLAVDDPLQSDDGLAPDERDAMRRRVLLSVAAAPRPRWRLGLALAGVLIGFVAAGLALTRTVPPAGSPRTASRESPSERRQLQFATPGGTRVIWTFNDRFDTEVQ